MAGLSLSLLALAALLLWAALGSEPYVATPNEDRSSVADGAARADVAGAAGALVRLERAVRRRDPAAARTLAAPGTAAVELLPAVVRNARRLDVRDFSLRYVDETGVVDAQGSWTADVALTWAFGGYDRAPGRTEVSVRLRSGDDGVQVSGLGGGGMRTPVWLAGPVQVAASSRTLVVAQSREDASRYDRQARRAVRVVGRVLSDWRGTLVVEVPADQAGLEGALDAEPGAYSAIAAVTAAVDGRPLDAPTHVVVNPTVYDRLGPQGAQVVMSHEAVHVATRAPSSSVPLWLLEGFADYVALRDVDLPLTATAGQVIDQVGSDGAPTALPGPAEFDTGDAHLGAAYEAAWLACVTLAERGGEAALVELYDVVGDGTSIGVALQDEFGWSRRDLVRAWRLRLEGLTP